MARDEPAESAILLSSAKHVISLVGSVDEKMVEKLCCGLDAAPEDKEVVVELTTQGGDAELGRRMALEIREAGRNRLRPLSFVGKTQVHSAGVTIMGAFPKERRKLARDAVLLIHGRQLDEKVEIAGSIRSSLPQVNALRAQIEVGLELEEREFRELIKGSKVEMAELLEKAASDWYLTADKALELGLVEALID